jgi:hypothetical protein
MPLGLPTAIFGAIEKGLAIWDFYNKTRYQRQYKKLIKKIANEEAKPVYGDNHRDKDLRDQNIIDRAYLDLQILLTQFLDEPNDYNNNQK